MLPTCRALWSHTWNQYHVLAEHMAAESARRESVLIKVHLPGPVALAQQTLQKFGWDARDPLHWRIRGESGVQAQDVPEVHVLDTPLQVWLHWLREGARRWRWALAGQSRQHDLAGLRVVDRGATCALAKTLPARQQGILHTIWAGAVPTQDLLFRQKSVDDPCCPHCLAGVAESIEHRHWHCTAWADIRRTHGLGLGDVDLQALPLCLRTCGVCPQAADVDRAASLPVQKDVDPDMPHIDDVWLTVYTDGAATRARPDYFETQRAGYAMVNVTQDTTVAEPLSLEGQTAQRAELRGILRALFEPGRVEIFSDSSYGVRTVTRLLSEELPRPLPLLKNGDLLWRLAAALRQRPPDSVRIDHCEFH